MREQNADLHPACALLSPGLLLPAGRFVLLLHVRPRLADCMLGRPFNLLSGHSSFPFLFVALRQALATWQTVSLSGHPPPA